MKKILLAMLLVFGAAGMADAQVCKINGTTNDNVEVFNAWADVKTGKVYVTVSNDSKETSANVTVTVKVRCKINQINVWHDETVSCKGLSKPGSTTLEGDLPKGTSVVDKCEPTSITGTKCIN